MQMPEGGGALMTSVLSSFLLPWCTCNAFKHNCKSTCNFIYNFQRWMSWLEQRWRAQRSAISIVNCRIPWTNRILNAYCAFGISLKACFLQCLHYIFFEEFVSLKVLLVRVFLHPNEFNQKCSCGNCDFPRVIQFRYSFQSWLSHWDIYLWSIFITAFESLC